IRAIHPHSPSPRRSRGDSSIPSVSPLLQNSRTSGTFRCRKLPPAQNPSGMGHFLRRFRLLAFLFPCLLLAAQPLAADSAIEHYRVLWMKNPAREAVISWTTRTLGENHRVYFDTEFRNGDLSKYAHETRS